MEMSKYTELHDEYENCIREAIKRENLIIECGSLSEARRTRVGFYNYIRYLNGVMEKEKSSASDRIKAGEIVGMFNRLSLKCDKAGILELSIRSILKDGIRLRLAVERTEAEKRTSKRLLDKELTEEAKLITKEKLREETHQKMSQEDILKAINSGD